MRTKIAAKASVPRSAARPAVVAQPTPEQISRRAKALWESYDRPTGRDEEIWLEAERQLRESLVAATSGAGDTPLMEDPEKLEQATEKIQRMGETPRGTQQILR